MQSIGDFFLLPYFALKTKIFNFFEERKVRKSFYSNALFQKADLALKREYQNLNPYTICRSFMERHQRHPTHVYGETPLTELYKALSFCKITKDDQFIDLGCGRGRICLFVSCFFSCKSTGIDLVPIFCEKAKKAGSFLPQPPQFLTEDMLSFKHLQQATVLYFYGLCMEEEDFFTQIALLESTQKNTKVITVSFPLSEYSACFSTIYSYDAVYPWGKTTLFINQKI